MVYDEAAQRDYIEFGRRSRGGPCAKDGRNLKVDSVTGSVEIEGGEILRHFRITVEMARASMKSHFDAGDFGAFIQ